ncbi:MAG: TonB-dependent receptor [Pseudohongiellaceae bacterium]
MIRRRSLSASIALAVATTALPAAAQEQAEAVTPLEEIVVIGTRTERQLGQIPLGVSVINMDDIQRGRQELSLDESLARVPGLFMQNRYNFSQDLRVSIRGFGSRANFGMRGIKVFADGIPVTLADGQSGTDDLDIGSAQSIEVVRGPTAALYGAASGGVISITTEEPTEEPFVETKLTFGEYGHEKYQIKTGGQTGRLGFLVNASHLEMDGYRDFSGVQHSLINSKIRYDIDASSDIQVVANAVNSPLAQDSGGITLAEALADPTQAQSRNTSSNAGETFDQQRLGIVYNKRFSEQSDISVRGYSAWKDFDAFLPIGTHIPFVGDDGVVGFDRRFWGGGFRYTYESSLGGLPNSFTVGADADYQQDKRSRFLNNAGVKGTITFNQVEEAEALGVYFRNETALSDTLALSLGGRFDNIDLSVNDLYLANADQSGSLDFTEFSPSVGLLWNATDQVNLYASYATSFETPTFTELGSPAQELNVNLGGFANVNAQEAESFEIGVKGTAMNENVYYDLALFTMDVENEIVNVVSIANRAFFENANTDRRGLEAQVQADLTDRIEVVASYTYSDFDFDRFDTNQAAVGEPIPGIPEHQFYAEVSYSFGNNGYVVWDALNVGEFTANNAGTQTVDDYIVSNLRLGSEYQWSGHTFSPFIGINNLFDEEYFSNVRINAFGGRAYEPAPERHIYGGFNVRF